ncbi:NACHT domain protein [compost metagenome]
MENQTSVPSFLYTPPSSFLHPPVETRIQELPFSKISWEDFEKLCLRLVQLDSNVIHCQLYGERGQDQSGIDFYVRENTTSVYKVYQCKRVMKFTPAKIKEAVDQFIANEWSKKSKLFILCTSESMIAKEKADEIENQSSRLQKHGIKMQVWDSNILSYKLKQNPDLVDDFFGRPWVTSFCGIEASDNLVSRFDKYQLLRLRERLSVFYKIVFNTHDPGLLLSTKNSQYSVPLQNRYVVPDIVEKRNVNFGHDNWNTNLELQYDGIYNVQNRPTIKMINQIDIEHRIDIESWLLNSSRNVILGGPGSGKSTFLRYLAIDILSDEPKLNKVAQKYGGFLPIWIPFALWTKHISTNEYSLSEFLELWFKSWNEEELWPLIKSALTEERLLLLVDGLDESANIMNSQIVMDRLAVFVEQRKLPIIITSRPHGFTRLITNLQGMQVGELGALSLNQQKQISSIWFSIWATQMNMNVDLKEEEILIKSTTNMNSFMNELSKSQDLKELAKIPLLLTLLISLRLYETRLPQNRFKAYDKLVDHLISIHPQRRQTAAGLASYSEEISGEDLKVVLANLAYNMQSHYLEGVVGKNSAILIIETQLKDSDTGFGLDNKEARNLSKCIIELGENSTGLLVNKSQLEIGFFHRAFQEYLTAVYISRLPFEKQIQIIELHSTDPQWREVILALMQLNSRSEEVKQIIIRIKNKKILIHEKDYVDLLLFEAAFGTYNLPPNLIKELTNEAFLKIESEARIELREDVLKIALEGLKSSRTKEAVFNKLNEWFPGRDYRKRDLFFVIAEWEINNDVINYLFRGLFDESYIIKKSAAEAIVRIKDKADLSVKLIHLVKYGSDPLTVAAAFHALILGWINSEEIDDLINILKLSVTPELRLYSIWAKLLRGMHNESDLLELLELASRNMFIEYSLQPVITNLLNQAWTNSELIKNACIDSILNRHRSEYEIEPNIAFEVLIKKYYKDDDVINLVVNELKDKFPFNTMGFQWSLLSNFHESEKVIQAVDEWIINQQYREMEISFAALVGKTSIAKNKLISELEKSTFPYWIVNSLLLGWGMEDTEVRKTLNNFISSSISNASKIANFLPGIVKNKQECLDLLLKILMDENCERYDFCLDALKETGYPDSLLEMLFELLHKKDDISIRNFLYQEFPTNLRVRELAKNEFSLKEGSFKVIATVYKDEIEYRNSILQILCPLDSRLRRTIAMELGNYLNEGNDNIFALLNKYDLESDDIAKTAASISYHNYLKILGTDNSNVIEKLSKVIVCYGPDYEERRQAAFVGLIILKRLEVMNSIYESMGEKEEVSISLVSKYMLNGNFPLIRVILDNWMYIKETFGISYFNRFAKFTNDPLEVWDNICLLINKDYPEALKDLLEFLETRQERNIRPNILRVLSEERPKSDLLVEYVLEQILNEKKSWDLPRIHEIAANILGEQFGNDEKILHRLLGNKKNNSLIGERVIIAICEGWKDSKELQNIYKEITLNKRELSIDTLYQLISRIETKENFLDRILFDLKKGYFSYGPRNQTLIKTITRRLKEDSELKDLFFETIDTTNDFNEKFVLLKLIVLSVGVTLEVRQWAIKILENTEKKLEPEVFSLDISTGEYISFFQGVIELLEK